MDQKQVIQELVQISSNIMNLYQQMIQNEKKFASPKKNEILRKYLEDAMEVEDKLYQKIPKDQIQNVLEEFLKCYPMKKETNISCCMNNHPLNFLFYRIIFYFEALESTKRTQKEEIIENYLGNEILKKEFILKQQQSLSILSLLYQKQKSNPKAIEYFYHFIFLNKFLEKPYIKENFFPMNLFEIEEFMNRTWQIESFGKIRKMWQEKNENTFLNELSRYLQENKEHYSIKINLQSLLATTSTDFQNCFFENLPKLLEELPWNQKIALSDCVYDVMQLRYNQILQRMKQPLT